MCGLLALGAARLTELDLQALRGFARVDGLRRLLSTPSRFCGEEFPVSGVSVEQRQRLLELLGQYGVLVACRVIGEEPVSIRPGKGEASTARVQPILRASGTCRVPFWEPGFGHQGGATAKVRCLFAASRPGPGAAGRDRG